MGTKLKLGKEQLIGIFVVIATSIVALLLRYIGRNVQSGDFYNVLIYWYHQINDAPTLGEGLKAYTGDYSLPYLYYMRFIGYLPFEPLYAIKIGSIIFDFLLAIVAGFFAKELRPGKNYNFCLGFALVMLNPMTLLNSGFWAQCDATYVFFLVGTLLFLVKNKPMVAYIFFGLALSIKLQAIMFLPFLLIYYWIERRNSILHFFIPPITVIIMNIPGMLSGFPFSICWSKYAFQEQSCNHLYYFYPNFWYFYQAQPLDMFKTTAMMLTVLMILLFVVLMVVKKVRFDHESMITIPAWLFLTCVMFLPTMHERYGFFVEIMALLWLFVDWKKIWFFLGLAAAVIPKYLYACSYIGNPHWIQAFSAGVNIITYILFTYFLWKRLFGSDGKEIANA